MKMMAPIRLWLTIEAVAAVLLGVLWLAAVALSLMSFGAPGTTVDVHTWAFVLTLWSYPIWAGAPIVCSWALLAGGRPRTALLCSLFPLVAGIAAGLLFWR